MTDHRTLREQILELLSRPHYMGSPLMTGSFKHDTSIAMVDQKWYSELIALREALQAAREAPADAPPATPRDCDCGSAPNAPVSCDRCVELPAAEPPAPPAQVLTPFTDQQEGQ